MKYLMIKLLSTSVLCACTLNAGPVLSMFAPEKPKPPLTIIVLGELCRISKGSEKTLASFTMQWNETKWDQTVEASEDGTYKISPLPGMSFPPFGKSLSLPFSITTPNGNETVEPITPLLSHYRYDLKTKEENVIATITIQAGYPEQAPQEDQDHAE